MKKLVIVILTFLSHFAYGQTLTLDDIIKIRTMDSVELREFCSQRDFIVKEKKEDNWGYSHSYVSSTNKSIWFIRTFSKDSTRGGTVYYYFTAVKTQGEFKKAIKDKGFKFKRNSTTDHGGNKFTHNIYLKDDTEIDLGTQAPYRQKTTYALVCSTSTPPIH